MADLTTDYNLSDIELLMQLLQRPQYVYKMAKSMLDSNDKSGSAASARTRRDNALREIGRMIDHYNRGNLWIIVEEEKVKLLQKQLELEAKDARRRAKESKRG